MLKMISALALGLVSAAALAAGTSVTYQVDGLEYEGYYVTPTADAPLVLLIHDWDGMTAYEVKRADMLAEMGYAVFAADLFGKGIRPTEESDKRQHTGELYQDREKMRALMYGALEAAKAKGANTDRTVVMGYCFGGAAVLEFARSGAPMKGFASFHGGLSTPEGQDYSQVKAKILVLHGSADTAITLQDFADLGTRLEAAGTVHEMTTYSGAPHAFTVFDSDRYREDADKLSWKRFGEFLQEQL